MLDLIILTSLQFNGSIVYHGLKFLVHGFEFNPLTPTPQTGQTHSNNSLAAAVPKFPKC